MGSDDCTEYEKAVSVSSEVSTALYSSWNELSLMPETESAMDTTMKTGSATRIMMFVGWRSRTTHKIGFLPPW